MKVYAFPNNPFQENTYILSDESGACAIVDPGMSNAAEERAVSGFIEKEGLRPALLLNTHCHVDHVLGNRYVFEEYGLLPQFHEGEAPVLSDVQVRAPMFGLRYEQSPIPEHFLPEEGEVTFGNTTLKLIFAPGHSPAHLCFYHPESHTLIGGDVLFRGSIGRTDLPGGNHQLLLDNIAKKLYVLPEETVVWPGHGPETTIGVEKQHNPYIRG